MNSGSKPHLSWATAPFRELLRLAWPNTVSMLSYSFMTLVDTLLVGHLGSAELAGVGLGGIAAFVFLCFAFGLLRAVKTLVAQATGAGRTDEVGPYLGAALAFALGLGLLATGLGEVAAAFIGRLAATPESGQAAATYLSIRILGAPLALTYGALREVRYGVGDAQSPMRATVLANVVNIVLAAAFVYGAGWGVAGAAIATVIAHAVEAGSLLFVQRRFGWGVRAMTSRHLRALWRMGLPTGLQFLLEVGSFALLSVMIAALSETEMAAHQIAIQVIHFSFLPAFAVAEAAAVLAGQAVGAGRDALVLRVARQALALSTAYTGACTLLLAFGARLIAAGFTASTPVVATAVSLLRVAAVFQIFDGASMVARATLRGTGDVRFAAGVGISCSWLCTPPLTWLLGYHFGLGALGGWLGLTAEIVVCSLVLWWRLERRGWWRAAHSARAELAAASDAGVSSAA